MKVLWMPLPRAQHCVFWAVKCVSCLLKLKSNILHSKHASQPVKWNQDKINRQTCLCRNNDLVVFAFISFTVTFIWWNIAQLYDWICVSQAAGLILSWIKLIPLLFCYPDVFFVDKPNHLSKAPPPNTILLGIRFQHMKLGGGPNIWAITLAAWVKSAGPNGGLGSTSGGTSTLALDPKDPWWRGLHRTHRYLWGQPQEGPFTLSSLHPPPCLCSCPLQPLSGDFQQALAGWALSKAKKKSSLRNLPPPLRLEVKES